ncbi:energy-coupling factor transporter ATPase [Eubacterium sp.]
MGIINIKHLVHKFKDNDENAEIITAIDGVDLDVEEGQFIAILGHNGSGKSSLAKHINALLAPTEGTVLISGMNTKDEKKIWDIRQQAGMVFQNPDNQIVSAVVEEDVAFGPENLGVPTEKIWEQVNYALKAVDMTAYRLHSPMKLSGGQKQRVAIAGIIAMEPKCIILDEPTAMLDPIGREEVISTLEELNKAKNITIILITHHMSETIHADKIFVMNNGKIELQGTPREVFSEVEKMKELGLEVPQVTELGFELQKEGLNIKNGTLEIDELVDEIVRVYNNN